MPLAKALRSFNGRYGLIRSGSTFNPDPGYYAALLKKKWIEPVQSETPRVEPGPADNAMKPDPPGRAGKENAGPSGEPASSSDQHPGPKATGRRRGAGKAQTSRSLRQDLLSVGKTSKPSDAGETSDESGESQSGG